MAVAGRTREHREKKKRAELSRKGNRTRSRKRNNLETAGALTAQLGAAGSRCALPLATAWLCILQKKKLSAPISSRLVTSATAAARTRRRRVAQTARGPRHESARARVINTLGGGKKKRVAREKSAELLYSAQSDNGTCVGAPCFTTPRWRNAVAARPPPLSGSPLSSFFGRFPFLFHSPYLPLSLRSASLGQFFPYTVMSGRVISAMKYTRFVGKCDMGRTGCLCTLKSLLSLLADSFISL